MTEERKVDWGRLIASHAELLEQVEREQCEHEQTHRGGAIWTICDDCGQKWADDRGGFQPYVAPDWLVEAREVARQSNSNSQPTLSDDLTARMVALVRKLAAGKGHMTNDCAEVQAIAAQLPEPVDPVEAIARRLIDQADEPWPQGTESDRLHYWRNKAIRAANDLRALERGEG